MAVAYKNKEILLSAPTNKLNVDIVYARPEDVIKLNFDIKSVKVTFVNGDIDLIFSNGSVISLASYATLAFDSNAPKIFDVEGKQVFLENLLQQVQVLKPEDAILILANRDKYQLVQNEEQVNKIIMATEHTGESDGGNPIAGVGEVSNPTTGLPSSFIDKTGNVVMRNLKNGLGDYLSTHYTTNLRGASEEENILPGNTNIVPQPNLIHNFLFGDKGVVGESTTINGNKADYYAVKFGVGDSKESSTQMKPIDMNNLGGQYKNKVFDAHAVDGKITRVMKLDYSGGIFPQTIIISGIPDAVDSSGKKLFNLDIKVGGTTKLTYSARENTYSLTQLDPTGKIELWFVFNDTIPEQNLNIKYTLLYYDPKTSENKFMETFYDVGIRSVHQKSDLSLNAVVLNKGASGIIVDADNAGTGDKIFIGGNVENKYESRNGQSLIFLGGGKDVINLVGTDNEGKNLIYGSTGYNVITGSGNGNDWLIYDNDKKHNAEFLQSDAIKDNYYKTMKPGASLQFYLGVPTLEEVNELWIKLGFVDDPWKDDNDKFKDYTTSNFVYTFNSVTIIGDRNNAISINNIIGTKEADTFHLYFKGIEQKVNIFGGNADTVVASSIVFYDMENGETTIAFGLGDTSSLTSKGTGAAYNFDTKSFDKITSKGSGKAIFEIMYDGKGGYRSGPVYFTGGSGENVVDFSKLVESASIVFDADARYNQVQYKAVNSKSVDYFYNFNHIIGSKGNDTFLGNSNSRAYVFDGGQGENILSYEKSVGGVTFNAIDKNIYKVSSLNITDYEAFKATADKFVNIQVIQLSNSDNVIIGDINTNIGSSEVPLIKFGANNNTIRYDLDKSNVDKIVVLADELTVIKNGDATVIKNGDANLKDIFTSSGSVGSIRFIGTKGDDLFYGGYKYSNYFDGKEGNNTLSYQNAVGATVNLIFDLSKKTVAKGSKVDTFANIATIIGGKGDDTFSIGSFDPTQDMDKLKGIQIDGGGGTKNAIQFTSVITTNLAGNDFILKFNVDADEIDFKSKTGEDIKLNLTILGNIQSILGTSGSDKFIASKEREFHFDGGGQNQSDLESKIYGNTLDYSNFDSDLTFDLVNKNVDKGNDKKDTFLNIQAFYGGKANDTFKLTNSLDDKLRYFDGNEGSNTINYETSFKAMFVDFTKGLISFGEQDKDKLDIFRNINTFVGGKGNVTFLLAYESISFNDKSDKFNFVVDGGGGLNALDFSNWGVALGVAEEGGSQQYNTAQGFVLSTSGEIKTKGNAEGSIGYKWSNIQSFVGSKFSDSFIIKDEKVMIVLDGNKDTQGDGNKLDYSSLKSERGVSLNVSTGIVEKGGGVDSALPTVDSIKNIQFLKLTNKDDIVKFANGDNGNLSSLKSVDGGGGNNTIDYSHTLKDVEANIIKSGFEVKGGLGGVSFVNFNAIKASRGDSKFVVTDDSNGSQVFLYGNLGIQNGKSSVLDLTQINDIKFWNITAEDNPNDKSLIGKLTWGGDKNANIVIKDINKVKLGKGKNLVYASIVNHSHYIGSTEAEESVVDYSMVNDSLTVFISDVEQKVKLNSAGGEDIFTNFTKILGSKGNDTFIISDVDKIANNINFDGNTGTNTLSFISSAKSINIDISLEKIKVENKDLQVNNVAHLVLSNNDDTVNITNATDKLLFNNIDGGKGKNTFNVANNGVITFNEKNDNKLKVSNIPNKEILLNNFQVIQTNAKTGNKFYSSYGNGISFKVFGSTNDDVNVLSYAHAAAIVEVNFTNATTTKGDKVDSFAGINYFIGSTASTIYSLAKQLTSDNSAFKTIYINKPVSGNQYYNSTVNANDIISINQAGDNAKLIVSDRKLEDSEIVYEWYDICVITFTNNQTVVASFDENYKYSWSGKVDSKINNTTLIFDSSKGKGGAKYDNGYVIVDTSSSKAVTYDSSGGKKAEITFSGLTNIVGTGSEKDIFYGGPYNISFFGGQNSGKATLSYEKYAAQAGITVIFDENNGAKIVDSMNEHKVDNAKFVAKYIGTTEDDTFIIANNKGKGQILIDGSGGIYNKVDYSQIAKDSGIVLDTQKRFQGDFDYGFTNISTFRLTLQNDTVLGSLTNEGFAKEGEKFANIIIDGNKGENTLDYSQHVKGKDKDHINSFNVDLQIGVISKFGYLDNGQTVTTTDTIAIKDKDKIVINFKNIILSGNFTTNVVIISGGINDKKDSLINVVIKNATPDLKQEINFEFLMEDMTFTWDNNALTGTIYGESKSYVGFNSIRLGSKDSTIIINNPTNMLKSGGSINGGDGNNTFKVINNNENSSIEVDLTLQKFIFALAGNTYIYSMFNFQNIILGASKNLIYATDIGNYNFSFTSANGNNIVSYININSAFTRLVINDISDSGVKATVIKGSIADANVILGTDVLENVNNITLSNNDDILDVKNNNSNLILKINGAKGNNTVSFERSWEGSVDIDSITGGKIKVRGYELTNFSKIILTKNDDNIKLKADSNIEIDGGGGNNSVDYTVVGNDPKYTQGIVATEYKVISAGNVEKIGVRVMKEGKFTDSLIRFNKFIFAQDKSNHYTPYFVNCVANSPQQFVLDFNRTANADKSVINVIDYSKLENNSAAILAKISFGSGNNGAKVNLADVTRNKVDADKSIKDQLIGINRILGTNKGDKFIVDTSVENLEIEAGISNKGELELNLNQGDSTNLFVWDLYNKTISKGNIDNPSKVGNFLGFLGIMNIVGVVKGDTRIDNVYKIFSFNINYVISNASTIASKSNNVLDISGININSNVMYDLTMNQQQGLVIQVYAGNSKSKNITATGITTVIGSITNQNVFNLVLGSAGDPNRSYVIIGRGLTSGNLDTAKISGIAANTTAQVLVNGDSSLTLGGNQASSIVLKSIPLFSFGGEGNYNLVFNTSSKGAVLNISSESKVKLYLDFTNLNGNDFSLILSANSSEVRSAENNLLVKYNYIAGIKFKEETDATVFVKQGVNTDKEMTYDNFSHMNFTNYHGNYNLNIKGSAGGTLTTINKLSFFNKKNIEIYLPAATKEDPQNGRVINLSVANISQNILISMNPTLFNNKLNINISDYKNTSDLTFSTLSNNLIGFNFNGVNSKFNIENAKHLNFLAPMQSATLVFDPHFNYFSAGSVVAGIGLTIKLNSSILNLDFSLFNEKRIYLQAVKVYGGEFSGKGYHIGFDGVKPDFSKNTGYITVGNSGDSLFYNNVIKSSSYGMDFAITAGWLLGAVDAYKTNKVTKGVVLDGTAATTKAVDVIYYKDVSDFFKGKIFSYNVSKSSNGQTNYELFQIGDNKVKFTMLNIASLTGVSNIDSTFYINTPSTLNLQVSSTSNNIINFSYAVNSINLYVKFTGTSTDNKDVTVYGTVAGYNVVLSNFKTIYISPSVLESTSKFVASFDMIPNIGYTRFFLTVPPAPDQIGGSAGYAEIEKINHILDFTPIGTGSRTDSYPRIEINTYGHAYISGHWDNKEIHNKFVVSGFNHFILHSGDGCEVFQYNSKKNFLFNAATMQFYKRIYNIDPKVYVSGTADTGIIQKKNSDTGALGGRDYLINFSVFSVLKSTLPDDELLHNNMILYFSSQKSANLTNPSMPENNNFNGLETFIFNRGANTVHINIDGISKLENNVMVIVNDIGSLNIQVGGLRKDIYKVYHVSDNTYFSKSGEITALDTNGYFAIVDTTNNNIIYIAGKDVEKYTNAFYEFLNNKQDIKEVNNYQELKDTIDKNITIDNTYIPNKNPVNEDPIFQTSSYEKENTNHSFYWDLDEEQNMKDKDNATMEEDLFLNIIVNTQDNTSYLDISKEEILEFTNLGDLDNISSSVLEDIDQHSNENHEEAKEDLLEMMNDLQNLSTLQEENSLSMDSLLSNNSYNNDATSKIEESINKHNSMNGENHK